MTISNWQAEIDETLFKQIIFSLEKYSNHPIAKAITAEWKTNNPIQWKKIEEIKGLGYEGRRYRRKYLCFRLPTKPLATQTDDNPIQLTYYRMIN